MTPQKTIVRVKLTLFLYDDYLELLNKNYIQTREPRYITMQNSPTVEYYGFFTVSDELPLDTIYQWYLEAKEFDPRVQIQVTEENIYGEDYFQLN